jgi:hypothetical protein
VDASAAVVSSDGADDADLPPGAESVVGSGFRSAAPGLKHTDSLRGSPEEDSPREDEPGVLAASGSRTPVIELTSGLEATLKGPITACVSLRAVLESRDKVEGWFLQRLLAVFDADGWACCAWTAPRCWRCGTRWAAPCALKSWRRW